MNTIQLLCLLGAPGLLSGCTATLTPYAAADYYYPSSTVIVEPAPVYVAAPRPTPHVAKPVHHPPFKGAVAAKPPHSGPGKAAVKPGGNAGKPGGNPGKPGGAMSKPGGNHKR